LSRPLFEKVKSRPAGREQLLGEFVAAADIPRRGAAVKGGVAAERSEGTLDSRPVPWYTALGATDSPGSCGLLGRFGAARFPGEPLGISGSLL